MESRDQSRPKASFLSTGRQASLPTADPSWRRTPTESSSFSGWMAESPDNSRTRGVSFRTVERGRTLALRVGGKAQPCHHQGLPARPRERPPEPAREIAPSDPAGVFDMGAYLSQDGASYVYTYFRSLSNLFLVDGLK